MNIEITKEGNGPAIKNGQTAVVSYIGKLENGTIFDQSKNHGDGSFAFLLGAGQVIKGWDQGVLGMQVGESRTLTIPSDLAYGPSGIPGVIPPNATLVFEVTLLAIK
jgi:peptidylprolyl isomerase